MERRAAAHILVLLSCWLLTLAFPRPVASAPSSPAATWRLRIGVTADGLVRLTPADLAAAGVDPSTADPRTFALSSLGRPVAIRVEGESDGRFDAGDYLEFFGQRFRGPEMEQKYTDERVYWLEAGGQPGPRIPDVEATPRGDLTPPADFLTTLRAEDSLFWWTLHSLTMDTQDTWFWARLQPLADSFVERPLPWPVPDPVPSYPAQLRVELISRKWSDQIAPDHRTTVAINGIPLLDVTWDGKVRQVFTATVPAGILASGMNTVTVGAWAMPGVGSDDVYVNYWELTYHRALRAWGDQLDFTAQTPGEQEYRIGGWIDDAVEVWEVTDPEQPRRLTGARAEGDGAEVAIRFRVMAAAGARYWLQAVTTVAGPDSVRLRPATGLRSPPGGADAVIVTAHALRPAAERLAAWHQAHGRRAIVAEIADVYDEFNDGVLHPKAVPAMLAWAQDHWEGAPPAYLTLMGDGHWNFKGFNPVDYPPEPNLIPPYLAWTDPWQGEVPADALYGDLSGDQVPDLAVGRLAVNTLAEAQVVVDKIIAYDPPGPRDVRARAWQRQALFVADNPDDAGDFPALSDEIIGHYLPADLLPQRVYLGQTVPDAVTARAAISQALQAGVWLVQFSGHGAPERWTHEQIWRSSDIAGLHNGDRLPVVMTFSCLDGYFAYPGRPAIAELMQRQPGGGSVAALSPSGLGLTEDQHRFRQLLMEVLFREDVQELGQALLVAKQRFYARYGPNYLLSTMMLYGDPAMRLPAGLRWNNLPLIFGAN